MDILHGLEPVGVGARNLQECLLLQVNQKKDCPTLVNDILTQYFLEFADRKWKPLSKQLGVEINEIQWAADYIKTLNPRPGAAYHSEQAQYIVPDLIVTLENDTIELDLFQKHLPNVQFQKDYYKMMSSYKDQQVKHFLKEKNTRLSMDYEKPSTTERNTFESRNGDYSKAV